MKSNELMIGDWVYNKNTNCNIQVYPTMFSQMFRQHPDATTEDYNIFPIPLTGEILEKNGFKKDEKLGEMYYWNWKIGSDCISYDKETRIVRIFHTFGYLVFVLPLSYVHEFQHALRLCGIEKEIEL